MKKRRCTKWWLTQKMVFRKIFITWLFVSFSFNSHSICYSRFFFKLKRWGIDSIERRKKEENMKNERKKEWRRRDRKKTAWRKKENMKEWKGKKGIKEEVIITLHFDWAQQEFFFLSSWLPSPFMIFLITMFSILSLSLSVFVSLSLSLWFLSFFFSLSIFWGLNESIEG